MFAVILRAYVVVLETLTLSLRPFAVVDKALGYVLWVWMAILDFFIFITKRVGSGHRHCNHSQII
jgi:hypothetical protein